mgnify:CR=1 FL=1
MRVILRFEAYPELPKERQNIVAMEMLLERMQKWLKSAYPEWDTSVTVVVGYEDTLAQAQHLLAERWVSKP